jgi:hypothetical protein
MKGGKILALIGAASLIVIAAGGCPLIHEQYAVPGEGRQERTVVTETDLTSLVSRPVLGRNPQSFFSSSQYLGIKPGSPRMIPICRKRSTRR